MEHVRCIKILRDNQGYIHGYRLQDTSYEDRIEDVKPDELKNAMLNNQINVLNLTLTSNNTIVSKMRLCSELNAQNKYTRQKQNVNALINKAKILGKGEWIPTACGNPCYLISKRRTEHIIYIPDNVTVLNKKDDTKDIEFTGCIEVLKELYGKITIVGGSGLTDTQGMFWKIQKAALLDISLLDTGNVTDMSYMFYQCRAKIIGTQYIKTDSASNMYHMFEYFNPIIPVIEDEGEDKDEYNLDMQLNVRKNINMHGMFSYCKATSINISLSSDSNNLINMSSMFYSCKAKSIDISSSSIHVKSMNGMFFCCTAECVILSSLNVSGVESVERMFCGARINYLNMESLNISTVKHKEEIFEDYKGTAITIKDISDYPIDMFDHCNAEICETDDNRHNDHNNDMESGLNVQAMAAAYIRKMINESNSNN